MFVIVVKGQKTKRKDAKTQSFLFLSSLCRKAFAYLRLCV